MAVFFHLGLPVFKSTQDDTEFYAYEYKSETSLSIGTLLAVQDQLIRTTTVDIEPGTPTDLQGPREWLAYSPETLIRQYGPPSRVDIAGAGTPHELGAKLALFYVLDMYFDAADLIVEYKSVDGFVKTNPATDLVRVCPVTDQFEFVRMWFGKNPHQPPISTYPIEKAASLSIQQFATLMTGQVGQDCFNVSAKFFSG